MASISTLLVSRRLTGGGSWGAGALANTRGDGTTIGASRDDEAVRRASEDSNRRMLRARDAIDRRYAETLNVPALARSGTRL